MNENEMNQITGNIIGAAMAVYTALGPGLLENAYEGCLVYELRKRNFKVDQQLVLPVYYDGLKIDVGYRLDILVEDVIIVEIKSIEKLAPIHEAQLLTYLRLSDKRLGLLINFNAIHLTDGIKRVANKF